MERCVTLPPDVLVSEVLKAVSAAQEELGIAYFAVGQESMEQVFLNFARKEQQLARAEDEAFIALRKAKKQKKQKKLKKDTREAVQKDIEMVGR